MTRKRNPILQARLLQPLLLALSLCGAAQAQSLTELYEAARAYDATYLAARAQAEAAEYKAAQANALGLPTLSANVKGVATQIDLPGGRSGDNNALQSGLNGRMPLFNKANQATMEQAQRSLIASKAELESAEQDLIIRLTQAYFDVLAAKDTVALTKTSPPSWSSWPRPSATSKSAPPPSPTPARPRPRPTWPRPSRLRPRTT
jgi:outer membrane protein